MSDITLYYAPDNASLIVRIVLEELGVSYRSVLVDRSIDEQHSESYRQLNPTGLIPVCIIDGAVVTETAAIALVLAEAARTTLAPAMESPERPAFLRWLFFLSNTLHADLRHLFYAEKYVGDDALRQARYREVTRARITSHLAMLETQYEQSAFTCLLRREPAIVDIYLCVCLRWLQLYPLVDRGWLTLADYPQLAALARSLERREAVIRACGQEGITGKFFSEASDAVPPEGSAL
jgi:glutathione S-transferase